VWETCGKKGLIPVEVIIKDAAFECKLIPKGNGAYVIPVSKAMSNQLRSDDDLNVKITILEQLTRINNNSPFTKANPIRNIDKINYVKQPADGYCGQACLAMLAGLSVEEVTRIMKCTQWQASIGKVLETLDYFGFSYKTCLHTWRKSGFSKVLYH
jgi:hypothetical protein